MIKREIGNDSERRDDMSNTVECPYCKYDNKVTYDDHDGQDSFDMTCGNCNEEFEVNVEYNPIYNSSKIENEECDKCKELERRYKNGIRKLF